ncbi:MAG TPA: transporter substrate-binding domain-containing protein, partial [Burkholderiaceae bacterium]|nr:transporter substrate-binding domain-containing protein [Burkholderiaceae bacterium]
MNFRSSLFRRVISNVSAAVLTLATLGLYAQGAFAQTAEAPAPKLPPTLSKVRDTGVVTIAFRPDAIPFAYLDENKQPVGYGIDICREIVRLMERELKRSLRVAFVEVSARTRFDVVNSGKADMECGTTINDPQRRKTVDYSMPYQFSGPRFLVRS